MEYLREAWTEKEVTKFENEVQKRLQVLATHPYTGITRNDDNTNTRQIVINKHILLIYKVKPSKQRIDLLVFWNTHQNPRKLLIK
jgi:plasmid stabilization system protein ParE